MEKKENKYGFPSDLNIVKNTFRDLTNFFGSFYPGKYTFNIICKRENNRKYKITLCCFKHVKITGTEITKMVDYKSIYDAEYDTEKECYEEMFRYLFRNMPIGIGFRENDEDNNYDYPMCERRTIIRDIFIHLPYYETFSKMEIDMRMRGMPCQTLEQH